MTFKKDSMRGLFYNKKFVSAFSLVAAFIFWLVITINQNPERTRVFSNLTVSVTTEGTAAEEFGLQVISQDVDMANVTISGPSYVIASLSAADISITADVADVNKAGVREIDLTARCISDSSVKVLSVSPAKIKVKFDYVESRTYKITPEHIGVTVPEGSGLSIEAATFAKSSDAEINISGPRTELDKIASVKAVANVNSVLSETGAFDADIKLFDVDGKQLDAANYTLGKTTVKITVPIYAQKNVPVVVVFDNKPSGRTDDDILRKQSVTKVDIKGHADLLETVTSIYVNIDYNDIEPNQKYEKAIIAPSGTKFSDGSETLPIIVETKRYKLW